MHSPIHKEIVNMQWHQEEADGTVVMAYKVRASLSQILVHFDRFKLTSI
jgi:hypothetical protein